MFATTHFAPVDDKVVPSQPHPTTQYEEDDTRTESTGGATLSTMTDPHDESLLVSSPQGYLHNVHDNPYATFESQMINAQASRYINTYFMDGGNRFISLPTLGNTCRAASHISRLFEEWLENKIYHHPSSSTDGAIDHLPILQDSPELLAEDILNKLKSRPTAMTGMSRVFIKVRTGHVYTYHQLEDGQPLVNEDMEDFFQQFPLFVEIMIYIMGPESTSPSDEHNTSSSYCAPIQVLLSVENATINPESPFYLADEILSTAAVAAAAAAAATTATSSSA